MTLPLGLEYSTAAKCEISNAALRRDTVQLDANKCTNAQMPFLRTLASVSWM